VIEITDKNGKVLHVHDQVVMENGVVGRLGPLHNLKGTFSVEPGVTGTDEWIGKDHSADIEIQAKPTGWVAPVELLTEGVPQVRRVKAEAESYERIMEQIRSFKKGDRVWIAEPHWVTGDDPFLYGTVVAPADLSPGMNSKVIPVLIDGAGTPVGFYASQLARNPVEQQPHGLRKLQHWRHRRKAQRQLRSGREAG